MAVADAEGAGGCAERGGEADDLRGWQLEGLRGGESQGGAETARYDLSDVIAAQTRI